MRFFPSFLVCWGLSLPSKPRDYFSPDLFSVHLCIRHRRQSDFEDAALEWLDGQHRDEIQRGLADQE